MKYHQTVHIKDSITTQLLKIVFGLYLIVALSTTITHMVAEYYNMKDAIVDELKVFQKTFEGVLTQILWNYDELQMHSSATGILEVPIITGVKIEESSPQHRILIWIVRDSQGRLITYYDKGRPETPNPQQSLNGAFWDTHDLHVEDLSMPIGKVTLYSNNQVVFQKVQYGFIFILVNSLIKSVSLWIIFLVVGRILLSRPLGILTNAAEQMELDNLEKVNIDINVSGKNELKVLEIAFNTMAQKLFRALQESQIYHLQLSELRQQIDIAMTDLHHAQSQLIQAEKMSTLGQLVAGVAHDIGNPVNYISVARYNAVELIEKWYQFLQQLVGDDAEAKEIMENFRQRYEQIMVTLSDIHTGEQKISEINHALRNYSRMDTQPLPGIDINEILKESLVILNSRIKRHQIEITLNTLPSITCHRSHIGQIFTNLIANASDAIQEKQHSFMSEKKEFQGIIRITTQPSSRDEREGVLIQIEDNGPGIPPEKREKVLEAFYTTKPVGVGTGLGLAICMKILKSHQGTMDIEKSPVLEGACFTAWLPV